MNCASCGRELGDESYPILNDDLMTVRRLCPACYESQLGGASVRIEPLSCSTSG